jgi:DNA-binding Lrp family transcriptional regulator
MRPFPGKLKRINRQYILTGWQGKWMREFYPKYPNKDIADAMGVCEETVKDLAKRYELEKDKDFQYYMRCKRIGKNMGCAIEHDVTTQKNKTCAVTTKLSASDYHLLCYVTKKKAMNKYQYLRDVIRKALQAESPIKECELF